MERILVAVCGGAQIGLLLLLLLSGRFCTAQTDLEISDFGCFNDYETEMFCSWEVAPLGSDCSDDFILIYSALNFDFRHKKCIPKNVDSGTSVLSKKCICFLENNIFVASAVFDIELESHGKMLQKMKVYLYKTVKPRTPTNVTINLHEKDTVIVNWNKMYTKENNLHDKLIYEVELTSKQNPKEVISRELNQLETHYKMDKRQLNRRCDYMIRVRSKPGKSYQGTWSEWSPSAMWHNDYGATVDDLLKIYIPISCIVILVSILLCYVCIHLSKKKWWINIPDPAKSKVVQQKVLSHGSLLKTDVNCIVPPLSNRKQKAKRVCTTWLNKWIFKTSTFDQYEAHDQFCQNYKTSGYLNISPSSAIQLLKPELTLIEKHIEIHPLEDTENNLSTEMGDDELDDDVNSPMDFFINKMFLGILESSACKGQASVSIVEEPGKHKKQDGSFFGAPFFSDIGVEDSLSSGYQNETSDNSQYVLQSNIDSYNCFCLNQSSGGQQPYTPKDDLVQSLSEDHIKADTFVDLDYSSFASAVYCSDDKTCVSIVDHESFLSPCFDTYQISTDIGKANHLNYNFLSNKNYFHDNDHNSINFRLSPKSEVSEYQSFADAVQQENLSDEGPLTTAEHTVLESGYKSFYSLLNQNIVDSTLDHFNCWREINSSETRHGRRDIAKRLSDSNVDNEVNMEKVLKNKLYSGFLNIHQMECPVDQEYKMETMEKSYVSRGKDSSYQNNNGEDTGLTIETNTTLMLQHENNKNISLALTFDIADHLKNFANTNGFNPLDKRHSKNIVSCDNDEVTPCCPVNCKSTFSKALLTSIQDQFYFNDTPNCQALKFENMSYFIYPCHRDPMILLNENESDPNKATNYLLVQHKVLDKDGNSYITTWLNKWIFKTSTFDQYEAHDQFCQNYKTSGYLNISPSSAIQLLKPELTLIEKHIEIHPLEDTENNLSTEMGDDELDDDVNSPMDFFINKMFLGILESSACKGQASVSIVEEPGKHKKQDGSFFGAPFFSDIGVEDSLSSGYQNETSNNSQYVLQSNIDSYNCFCLNQSSGGQQPYTPKDDLVQSLSEDHIKADTFVDLDYSSFASAVYCSDDKTCVSIVDHESFLSPCFDTYQISTDIGKANHLNYNFLSNKNYFHDNDHNSINFRLSPKSEVSEYQSFADAVQQENLSDEGPLTTAEHTVLESGYKSFYSLLNQNIVDSTLDHFNCWREINSSETRHGRRDIAKRLSDSNVDNEVNMEKVLKNKLYSGFLNIHQMECPVDQEYKMETMEKSYVSRGKDSSYQNNNGEDTGLTIETNTTLMLQHENNKNISLALTFDIADHLKNFANTNGFNPLDKRHSKNIVSCDNDEVTPCCPVNCKSTFSKALLTSIQDQFYFNDTPNCQALKFENMSYFIYPCHRDPMILLNENESDPNKATNYLLVQHKVLDKDGNSYMQVELS